MKIKTFVYKQNCLSNCTNKNVNHNSKHRLTFVFQNILAANTDICVHSKKAKGQSKVQWIYSSMDPSFHGSRVWWSHRVMNPWVDPRYDGDKVRWSQGSMWRLSNSTNNVFYYSWSEVWNSYLPLDPLNHGPIKPWIHWWTWTHSFYSMSTTSMGHSPKKASIRRKTKCELKE